MADKIYSFRIDIEDRGKVAEEILSVDQSLKKLSETRKKAKADLDKGNISQEKYNKILKDAKLRETELRVSKTALAKADRSLAKQTISTKGSMEALRQETSRLIQTANQLNLATKTGQKRYKEIQKQVDKNKTSIRNFDRQMSGSKTLVGEYGRGIVSSFKSMAAGLIGFTALIRVFRDLTKVTGQFDTATAKLASVTLSTREEISELTEQAKLLGSTTIFTASQVTDLQIALAKLGFTSKEISDSTAAVIDFATATGADLGAAAKVAGVAVRAFGLDALETGYAVASLAIGTTKSALAFEDYETILGTVGPVAKAYGFTLEDTIALTGRLRDAGFDASKAATATRNILLNLADANGALAQKLGGSVNTLDELIDGLTSLDKQGIGLNETLELTDKRSVAAFAQFLAGAESVRELKDQVTDTRDELEKMVDLALDSHAGDVKALSSAWEGLILALNASGAMSGAISFLKNAILQVTNLDLAFTKFHKQTRGQLSKSFDLLEALNNKQGTHFDEMIDYLDKVMEETGGLYDPDQIAKDFALIRNVNKKEGEALAEEYLRRREETAEAEVELQRVRAERIAQDEVKIAARREADERKAREAGAEDAADDARKVAREESKIRLRAETDILKEIDQLRKKWAEDEIVRLAAAAAAKTDFLSETLKLYENNEEFIHTEAEEGTDALVKQYDAEVAAFEGKERTKQEIFAASQQAISGIFGFAYNRNLALMDMELKAAGDNEQKKEAIRLKYAKKEQGIAIKEAFINAAQLILQAALTKPFIPAGLIAAGTAFTMGGIQIANIKQQKFEEGGKVQSGSELPGLSKSGDNTMIIAKPGEAILNARQQLAIGGAEVLRRARVPGFAGGGVVGTPEPSVAGLTSGQDLAGIMKNLKVTQNVNELHRAEDELAVINETSEL